MSKLQDVHCNIAYIIKYTVCEIYRKYEGALLGSKTSHMYISIKKSAHFGMEKNLTTNKYHKINSFILI